MSLEAPLLQSSYSSDPDQKRVGAKFRNKIQEIKDQLAAEGKVTTVPEVDLPDLDKWPYFISAHFFAPQVAETRLGPGEWPRRYTEAWLQLTPEEQAVVTKFYELVGLHLPTLLDQDLLEIFSQPTTSDVEVSEFDPQP